MARTRIILMTCPQGHSFITLQDFGYTFTCTECAEAFDSWQEGMDITPKNGSRTTGPRSSSYRRRARKVGS